MNEAAEITPTATGRQAHVDPHSIELEDIDVSDSELFEADTHWGYFERLRNEDPVHYCRASDFGPYWSVTKFDDIVYVEKNPELFSSRHSIVVGDPDPNFPVEAGFITMDGKRHDQHRATVQPVMSPRNIKKLEPVIRQRVCEMLDALPVGETFDWVDRVSIELTTGMLATLFDFPYEERRKLTFWSDMATASPVQVGAMGVTEEERKEVLMVCLQEFTALYQARKGKQAGDVLDLVTSMANGEAMQDVAPDASPLDFLGTLILLIVGGNDTTRNSISGGVLALNEHPAEYDKLRKQPGLVPNMVSEMIRWQTPLAHMRRTATRPCEIAGKKIDTGEKVVMWYVSANRDETVIERANEFLIDRKDARKHLSFGWGVHFCMGSRIAEMQLRVLWEEILARFHTVEVAGEPVRVRSNFVKGFTELPVRLHPL